MLADVCVEEASSAKNTVTAFSKHSTLNNTLGEVGALAGARALCASTFSTCSPVRELTPRHATVDSVLMVDRNRVEHAHECGSIC